MPMIATPAHYFQRAVRHATRAVGYSLLAGLLTAAAANATTITENTTIGPLTNTLTETTGGPYTFISTSAVFNQFDPSLGTLNSAALAWTITGSEGGSGNYAGTGVFNFGGQTQTVTFDTVSNPGPKDFNFTGSTAVNLASVTGLGTYSSLFTATMQQSGLFPWTGTMTLDASQITLTYVYTPAAPPPPPPPEVPEPATLAVFGISLLGFGALRLRKAKGTRAG